jgi:hypothetical protein
MKRVYQMKTQAIRIALITILFMGAVEGRTLVRIPEGLSGASTTEMARQLVLERIDAIAENGQCSTAFAQEKIDLELLRSIVRQTRFYDATGLDGDLRFSSVVGRAASPDQTLRALALQVAADAFVLGYFENGRYIRAKRVVLGGGYFERSDPQVVELRPTTLEEKQALLLHEILHIALDKDDDVLNKRALCPLHLLSFCPNPEPAGHNRLERSPSAAMWNGFSSRTSGHMSDLMGHITAHIIYSHEFSGGYLAQIIVTSVSLYRAASYLQM